MTLRHLWVRVRVLKFNHGERGDKIAENRQCLHGPIRGSPGTWPTCVEHPGEDAGLPAGCSVESRGRGDLANGRGMGSGGFPANDFKRARRHSHKETRVLR